MKLEMVFTLVFLSSLLGAAKAADPDPLQDTCVGDLSKDFYINGYPCKDPEKVTVEDFVFHGLNTSSNANPSLFGANATLGFVENFPGVNTLGLVMVRLDFAKGGLIPPHTHPRASEIIFVVEGSLYAGFVTTKDKLYAKVINKGDVMVFPRGLIHFQLNVGNNTALAIVALNSQSPGFQLIPTSMFGSNILDEVLEKTFFIDEETVHQLKATFGSSSFE